MLAWVYLRPVGPRFALLTTSVDIVAISVLAVLSGGAFSHARLAFFVVPVAVAFRFRPAITAAAVVVTTAAYVIQAALHPAVRQPEAVRFIVTQAGFLAWVGVACVLLSMLLARRTELVERLARRALAPARGRARGRAARAQGARGGAPRPCDPEPALGPARARGGGGGAAPSGARTGRRGAARDRRQLRDAVFDLHPYVLEQAGLEAALRSIAQQAAMRGLDLRLDLELDYAGRHAQEQLLFSAARELLANVVRHADATDVTLRLQEWNGAIELVVEDDGRGFPPERCPSGSRTATSASRRSACGSSPQAGAWTSCRSRGWGRGSRSACRARPTAGAGPT